MFFNYDNEWGSDCLIPRQAINFSVISWPYISRWCLFCTRPIQVFVVLACWNKNQQLDISLFRANQSLLFLLDAANTNFTSYWKERASVVNTNSTIFQLYHSWYLTNMLSLIVPTHWNSPWPPFVHIILIATCLEEKQQIPIYSSLCFDTIGNRTHYLQHS